MLPKGFTLKPSIVWNVAKVGASLALSHLVRRPVVWGRPVAIMMEPISRCNLQCPLCPIGARELKRELGTMTLAHFVRILDNVGPQVRVLALWNQGEPTINDALPAMIRAAHERGIYTMTSTNGNLLLRRNLIARLLDSGLDEIIFSIDGLTQETYQLYRIGGHLDVVAEAMQTLRRLRDARAQKTPRIVMQWLPMKHNQHEIPRLRKTASAWGADTVEIKTTQIYTDAQAAEFLPELKELWRYERRAKGWETKRRYQKLPAAVDLHHDRLERHRRSLLLRQGRRFCDGKRRHRRLRNDLEERRPTTPSASSFSRRAARLTCAATVPRG